MELEAAMQNFRRKTLIFRISADQEQHSWVKSITYQTPRSVFKALRSVKALLRVFVFLLTRKR